MLTKEKMDAMSHGWVADLANCDFHLHYRVRKAKINVDALLLRVAWSRCVTNATGTFHQVTAAVGLAV